jgi:hypothetical protein
MKRLFFLLIFFSFKTLLAEAASEIGSSKLDPPPSPAVIDRQLEQAQKDFETAKEMFNPYYAGPLLTPSAHNVPPGSFNIQPYLFFTCTFAEFNQKRHSVNIENIWQLKGALIWQMGLLSWLDSTLILNAEQNWQGNQNAGNLGDTQLQFGIQLLKEATYHPALRLVVSENFPTGKYKRLNSKKSSIQATGSGSYATTVSFNISKVLWWLATHPISLRSSFNYTIPTPVHVQGFNAYRGGFGTSGKVRPGNTLEIDSSLELSFTQHWVFALDLVYAYQNQSKFSGNKGVSSSGKPASVGAGSNDNLSFAPAIEYNPTESLGFLFGTWFSVTGRNSSDFISVILTMTYGW